MKRILYLGLMAVAFGSVVCRDITIQNKSDTTTFQQIIWDFIKGNSIVQDLSPWLEPGKTTLSIHVPDESSRNVVKFMLIGPDKKFSGGAVIGSDLTNKTTYIISKKSDRGIYCMPECQADLIIK